MKAGQVVACIAIMPVTKDHGALIALLFITAHSAWGILIYIVN
jgi:hypothetical protein